MNNGNKTKVRKISCLPCRLKKAKCDVLLPHCSRCIRNSRQDKCVYPKPRIFGRPPKNATFHKNRDNFTTATITCREFIFENVKDKQEISRKPPLIIDIERIFNLYIEKGKLLGNKIWDTGTSPNMKMRNLKQQFSILTSNIIHLTIKRSCQLLEVKTYFDPEITISAFVKGKETDGFFFNNQAKSNTLLNSVPTDQAMKLFNYFFQFHPLCILLNKTKLFENYWNDSVEPLLLSVIYGTAVNIGQHVLEGKPFSVCQSVGKRNPFLDYAYTLFEHVYTNRLISLGNYQAIVILSLYEIKFGLAKHGMTMLSLSYMMATELGVFDANEIFRSMDLIDRELLVTTYWAAFRTTSYGCLELGIHVRESLLFHNQPFPPASAYTSASYQYDVLHNNHMPASRVLLIECFHLEMVINYFSSKLFICLPTAKDNVFDIPTQKTDKNLALLPFQNEDEETTRYRIQLVLDDFSMFIEQEKHRWSPRQLFTIETTYRLYCIHFSFMKPKNTSSLLRYETVRELDLNNPNTVYSLLQVLPISYVLMEDLKCFVIENSDVDNEDILVTLPLGLMAMALETLVQVLIQNYNLSNEQDKILECLSCAYFVSEQSIWVEYESIKPIQKMLRTFLKSKKSTALNQTHQENAALLEQTDDVDLFLYNLISLQNQGILEDMPMSFQL